MWIKGFSLSVVFLCIGLGVSLHAADAWGGDPGGVDTALIVAVDMSGSVSDQRYRLQLRGIADALRDPEVLAAMISGPRGAIFLTMVAWADKPRVAVPWVKISSRADVDRVAQDVLRLPRTEGEFTCFGSMFRGLVEDVIPTLPSPATRLVVDVSGDGIENCTDLPSLSADRAALLSLHATINGLPILVPGENDYVGSGAFRAPGGGFEQLSGEPDRQVTTLPNWYRDHVVGGPGSFLMPAMGYQDFARAMRQKFLVEISFRRLLYRRSG